MLNKPPANTNAVFPLVVACPICHAPPGTRCTSAGQPREPHGHRRILAAVAAAAAPAPRMCAHCGERLCECLDPLCSLHTGPVCAVCSQEMPR